MAKRRIALNDLTDDELLDMRICDLGVQIEGSPLEPRINQLHEELAERGLRFRPHCWLSDDWYSPDGIPGIAIPFYLSHSRLRQLERRQLLEVEGGTHEWCMKILRHEAGHAIDTAYRLRRKRSYREMFGPVSQPYPTSYKPKPHSKKFVLHLDMWYAQSHPVEDFAETFATWLRPRSRWRSQYRGWPAIRKIEYVDRLMSDIREQKPVVRSRASIDPTRSLKKTLRQHYRQKRARYGLEYPGYYDRELRRLFS
ncbi:MAG: putative zinc-binding metallopeptidase, partial [Planctomycetales bacterium]|nr:putative zinc-binding metallopeptidase [Planctomycetales bacterium]